MLWLVCMGERPSYGTTIDLFGTIDPIARTVYHNSPPVITFWFRSAVPTARFPAPPKNFAVTGGDDKAVFCVKEVRVQLQNGSTPTAEWDVFQNSISASHVAAFSALNARPSRVGLFERKKCMATSTPIDLGTERVVIILVGLIASGKVRPLTFVNSALSFGEPHFFLPIGWLTL
jgi:hypothetical protein